MEPFANIATTAAITLVAVLTIDAAVRLWKVSSQSAGAGSHDQGSRTHRRAGREALSLAVTAVLGLVVVVWLV